MTMDDHGIHAPWAHLCHYMVNLFTFVGAAGDLRGVQKHAETKQNRADCAGHQVEPLGPLKLVSASAKLYSTCN